VQQKIQSRLQPKIQKKIERRKRWNQDPGTTHLPPALLPELLKIQESAPITVSVIINTFSQPEVFGQYEI
jgi:hypothetical protein